ncbi:Protein of unknown function [Gryllus bimaculatus]|nr:Protein of unknown function [Gryllus bimaculatus]
MMNKLMARCDLIRCVMWTTTD